LIKFQKRDIPKYKQVGLKREGDALSDRELLLTRLEMVDVSLLDVRRDISWFDETLKAAIKEFQYLHGLKPDGVIGPDTIRWLNFPIEKRLATLAINAERIRYWPTQRDTIILVNVPSYEMTYWDSGQTVFESKVVVGRKARPTPLMRTNLDTLILNPTWNIPWKIMVKDIIPKVKNDPQYLNRENIKIIPKWGSDEVIAASQIDWKTLNPNSFPYRMTQMSGHRNALGLYKFNTPNRRAIYLHDTPSKGLFNKTLRAYSSGCVRVEHADVFAERLLATQEIELDEPLSTEPLSNHSIPLRQRIPVHIIYQTAWYEAGNTHYREDIYRLDRSAQSKG
jgi:murein L,D-transpeptidase YcbB/YkuD